MNQVHPWRVLAKAVVLYTIANLAFAAFNPPVGKLSIYNELVPGRERVPYEREVEYYPVSHTIPVYEDMNAMYQSHILSQPKAGNEFRVMLLGDSSAWGFELHPEDTLVGQLNALHLTTCDGKNITVYNAAFPLPYVMKDLLIMDKVREYEPDLYLWTITLDAFRNRSIFTNFFLNPYADRVLELKDEYEINNLDIEDISAPTFWDKTIIGQRSRLKKIISLELHGFGWDATGLDYLYRNYPPLSNNQSDSLLFDLYTPDKLNLDLLLFDVLKAGNTHAGKTPLLIVNEPIFIATGKNSEIRYNDFYPRWAYDEYLDYLDSLMKQGSYHYVNAWNVIPSSEFTDTPFHSTPAGERMLAELLVPELQQLSCPK